MLAIELAEYLDTLGLVSYDPVTPSLNNVFIQLVPPTPDTAVILTQSGGPQSDSKLGYDFPMIQVRTRDPSPAAAYALCKSVYNALHGLHNITLGTTYVVSCLGVQSDPVWIGIDSNERNEYTLNFQFDVKGNNVYQE